MYMNITHICLCTQLRLPLKGGVAEPAVEPEWGDRHAP